MFVIWSLHGWCKFKENRRAPLASPWTVSLAVPSSKAELSRWDQAAHLIAQVPEVTLNPPNK